MTRGRSSNAARMPQPCNGLAPEERADILRVRPQGALCNVSLAKFAGTTGAPEVTQNAAPRAERAHYVDAGITQQILPGLKVGLDGYYKQAAYQLDEGQFGAPVFLTPFNYRRAYTLGIELTTTWVLGHFSAYGNLAAGQQRA